MRLLLDLDSKNYSLNWKIKYREAARAIIIKNNKIAMVKSNKYGFYKFPGGGIWENERIISKEWIDLVISNRYEFTHIKDGWYAKGGMRGQLLMFNREKKKAIACHSYESHIPYDAFI